MTKPREKLSKSSLLFLLPAVGDGVASSLTTYRRLGLLVGLIGLVTTCPPVLIAVRRFASGCSDESEVIYTLPSLTVKLWTLWRRQVELSSTD